MSRALRDSVAQTLAPSGRLGRDLALLLEIMPGLAGLGLFVRLQEEDGPGIARTDGQRLVVRPAYWDFSERERLGILTHELLHVGLAHPLRSKRLRAQDPSYRHDLWNIACDLVINDAIRSMSDVRLPNGCIDRRTLEDRYNESLAQRSSEQIYALLKTLCLDVDDIASGRFAGDSGDGLAGDIDEPEAGDPAAIEETIERWRDRMLAGIGHLPGIQERLRADLPTVTPPWQAILRSFVRRFSGSKREIDRLRPHQRWLAHQPLARNLGVLTPLHFGTRTRRTGRLAIVIDSSGSMGNDLLGRCTAEIIALIQQLDCSVRLIVADADVLQTENLMGPAGIARLRALRYRGGGGTDFAPAIARAAESAPDALVYLTDLYGGFGETPAFPVLWAVFPGGSPETPPFGRRIDLM